MTDMNDTIHSRDEHASSGTGRKNTHLESFARIGTIVLAFLAAGIAGNLLGFKALMVYDGAYFINSKEADLRIPRRAGPYQHRTCQAAVPVHVLPELSVHGNGSILFPIVQRDHGCAQRHGPRDVCHDDFSNPRLTGTRHKKSTTVRRPVLGTSFRCSSIAEPGGSICVAARSNHGLPVLLLIFGRLSRGPDPGVSNTPSGDMFLLPASSWQVCSVKRMSRPCRW